MVRLPARAKILRRPTRLRCLTNTELRYSKQGMAQYALAVTGQKSQLKIKNALRKAERF